MKIAQYFLIGCVAATADIGVYSIAVKYLQINWFNAALLSFAIGITINYLLSVRYVFESEARFEKQTEVILVILVSGIGLILNQCILWGLIEIVNCEEVISKIISTGVIFFWNYGIRKLFIF